MIHTIKNMIRKIAFPALLLLLTIMGGYSKGHAQSEPAREDDYFKILQVKAPEGTILEVGGLCTLPSGDVGVATRRGDVYIIENPTSPRPYFRKFASGLHEVLGLAYKDGALYCAQRGELTKLVDKNMDGKADEYETVYEWPLTGNYHEYSYGPKIAPDGSFFVTLNCTCPNEWWHMQSNAPWRGWTLHIYEDGRMEPWATGMRSPCGISMIDGELFYTDNQGDWVGSGSVMPIKKGAFTGHPAGLLWATMPNSPVKVTQQQVYAKNPPPPILYDADGKEIKPENQTDGPIITEYEMKKFIPDLQLPAVWLPHGILGVSNSEIVKIPEGSFGPFAGQLLVGDQGQSMLSRVYMETVNGELQGAAWPFRSGFQSGIVRLDWAKDGSLMVGETNRGWGSAGEASMGVQRLIWNNRVPFEMKTIHAMPDGFEINFTKPVDKKSAEDIASYSVESFIYKYQGVYGSPPVNTETCPVKGVKVSEDGLTVRIIVDKLRRYYIHTITLSGVVDKENYYTLVHPTAYYTLNSIPEGKKLSLAEVSTKNSKRTVAAGTKAGSKTAASKSVAKTTHTASKAPAKTAAAGKVPSFAMVQPLLQKNTCLACHHPTNRQVGPPYVEVAKRKYTIEQIIDLIHNPKPEHWPGYSTPMPPMPQVPASEARQIAEWINSLDK